MAGLPDSYESEGYDRKHLRIPENQNHLIEEIAKTVKRVAVLLYNGSPVEMPWAEKVSGILEGYLGGQNVGNANRAVLFGEVNPSGRLPETFPKRLEDAPCYLSYGGEGNRAEYSEGVFVGFRYYTKKQIPLPLRPRAQLYHLCLRWPHAVKEQHEGHGYRGCVREGEKYGRSPRQGSRPALCV